MKHSRTGRHMLRAAIVAALAITPALVCATTSSLSVSNALAGIDTSEAPRITQTINLQAVSTLQHTHLSLLAQRTPTSAVASSTHMQHLQLILQPSAKRTAALHDLVSQQHDPSSTRFHQWLTPAQYGQAFGVADSDIAAVTSWLVSQGFTVNAVYPN
ncbi:MAG TPA: protease pro-enzyme activation domain-containing protein, partial [Rhodanobacter sp.]